MQIFKLKLQTSSSRRLAGPGAAIVCSAVSCVAAHLLKNCPKLQPNLPSNDRHYKLGTNGKTF